MPVDEERAIGTYACGYLSEAVGRDVEIEEAIERREDKSRIRRTATETGTIGDYLIEHQPDSGDGDFCLQGTEGADAEIFL